MTYTPDFSGVWAKIARAEEHIEALNREIGTGGGPPTALNAIHRVPVRLDCEPESGYHVFRITSAPPEDAIRRWGIITGDAIHNLRSALDHLVWQPTLAGTGGKQPSNPQIIKFPIQDSPPPFNPHLRDFQKTAALYKVSPKYRVIIYEHQPRGSKFKFGYGYIHPFSRLRDLSNLDKHQLVIEAPGFADNFIAHTDRIFGDAGGEVVESHSGDAMGEPLVRDAEVVRVKVRPASVQVNMEMAGYIAAQPTFRDVSPAITHSVSVDIELHHMTTQTLQLVEEIEQAT